METLRKRAEVLAIIRDFFAERDVLEVETPLLASAPGTDLHLQAMSCRYRGPGHDDGRHLWLQTSPEFAMKRLLAADSGPIYQLCKAFRDGETGSRHNPEFTILEWYRPGWDHHQLMDEVGELLDTVLSPKPTPQDPKTAGERISYAEAFQRHVGIDPHAATAAELSSRARELLSQAVPDLGDDRDGWLELLLSHVVEPELGRDGPSFIYDFPASQAALAHIRPGDPAVAERFETWIEGVELANGYHELTDPLEQLRRFEADLAARRTRGLPVTPVDRRFLTALDHGLPSCAGVAVGVDRLVMLATGAERIEEVLTFPIDRA